MTIDPTTVGQVQFTSFDSILQAGFAWAKEQALAYAHHGEDPVGPWYEAALPGRDAFCIRDVSHQSLGAAVLGLGAHTKNMLRKFAASLSPERDYCMYWEITKGGKPAAVDYKNDADFWYNLPANFDMLQACWESYLWSGDGAYLREPEFRRFYALTCNEYIERWDKNGDGFPEYYPAYGRRGLASYNEQKFRPFLAGDLLGSMYAAYRAYAAILQTLGQDADAAVWAEKASQIQQTYLNKWYDPKRQCFFGALRREGKFYPKYYKEGNFLPLFFRLLDNQPLRETAVRQVLKQGPSNVEAKTYFPQLYYDRGLDAEGYRELCALCHPKLKRRSYPEVSFSVAGTVARQYMGVTPAVGQKIRTLPKLARETDWAQLESLPILGNAIDIRHEGNRQSRLSNHGPEAVNWKACFLGDYPELVVDGIKQPAAREIDAAGREISYVEVALAAGENRSVQAE